MSQKSYDKSPSLYLIPTPIGNMEDITIRALNILKEVDVIFSEDTRETLKLLKYFNINKKLVSCHKFNEDKVYEKALEYLKEGKMVGLVTDRGTPVISDPGYVVSYNVIKEGFNVIGLPGPTAFVPALIMSGLNPNQFLFYGFLDSKKSSKKKQLEELKLNKYTIIFYESPFRVIETLELIKDIMGDRNISISREISKKYEEIYRGKVTEVLKELIEPKGEFVIVVEGNKDKECYDDIDLVSHVKILIKEGINEKEAIKKVAKLHDLEKNKVYIEYHGGK
ncbi:MAG: 16S rRNA (cytidine(1402)-2'-O)-methyltransferase [Bacilli bacterium]|nr:16S rRNA (cytidine(1402)-2'-O)-methyltransferase [Bacilli bacterium]